MARSVLLMLNQMPHDPSSGAARNVRTQCEILASAGFRVRAVATTATEHATPKEPEAILREAGCEPRRREGAEGLGGAGVFEFDHRQIHYTLLDVGTNTPQGWEGARSPLFDRLVEEEVARHPPEILFTFGGQEHELRRRAMVRESGAAVVLAVLNLSYMVRSAFRDVDAAVTVSEYTRDLYREGIGLISTPLTSPFDHEDIVAEEHDPRFLTYINPSLQKGVMFFARLADEIAKSRPSLPMMVIESRGTAGHLVAAGERGKMDLRRHESIMVSPGVSQPKHIYAVTRVLLVPSVWEEPFGRVAAEALLNGIPPIVADRGGLPESAAGGGFVLPLPRTLTTKTMSPVPASQVRAWKALAIRLMTDDAYYEEARARAREAARVFAPEVLCERTVGFFSEVERVPGPREGPFEDDGGA